MDEYESMLIRPTLCKITLLKFAELVSTFMDLSMPCPFVKSSVCVCVCVWVFATSELVGHVDRTLNVVAALPQIECTLYSEPKFDCHLSKWKKAPKEESRVSRETAPFVQTTEPLHCFIPVSSLFAVIRVLFAEWFPTQHVSLVCLSFPNLENPWTTASKCKNNSRDSTSDQSQTTRISRANWQFPKELDPKTGPELYKKKTPLHIHEPRLNKD